MDVRAGVGRRRRPIVAGRGGDDMCRPLTKRFPAAHSPATKPLMATYIIDVPVPSMGATVSELTVVTLKTQPGDRVVKGQKIAELESDKSIFEYEAPADGTVIALPVKPGEVLQSGALFLRLETADASLRHLEATGAPAAAAAGTPAAGTNGRPAAALVWTSIQRNLPTSPPPVPVDASRVTMSPPMWRAGSLESTPAYARPYLLNL
jgi:pyruvate/2-oxoglutarate dehydrogenase complex dihydrolipoamide acyltransferase (E2) component